MSKWGFDSPYAGFLDANDHSIEDLAFSAYVVHDSILSSVVSNIVEYIDSEGFDRSFGVSMTQDEVDEFVPDYQDFTREELEDGLKFFNIYIE